MGHKIKRAAALSQSALGVQEASGLVAVGDERFLVVDDEHGIFLCQRGCDPVSLAAGKGMADLEGICATPELDAVFVLAERDGSVWRYRLRDDDLEEGERLGILPRAGKRKNHGWEGIAYAAGELVAVHQSKPAVLSFFDADTLKSRCQARLPKIARKALKELNDVAIHPSGGRLYVLGGRAGCIATLRRDGEELAVEALHSIESSRHNVPEGLTLDAAGRLWVCTDGEGLLLQLQL